MKLLSLSALVGMISVLTIRSANALTFVPRLPRACYFTFDKHFVCGSDGKTYDNPSVLNCAKEFDPSITLVHEGKCDEDAVPRLPRLCPTTGDLHFVCGSDGKTYDNPSVLNCAKKLDPSITLVHEGKCDKDAVPRLPIDCYFTFDKHFVCGSDGKTYDNPSVLNCAKEFDPSITLVHEGMCDEDADYH